MGAGDYAIYWLLTFYIYLLFFFLLSISSGRKSLEQRTYQDDERIAALEQQLAEAQLIAEDSDRKYDEVIKTINTFIECHLKLNRETKLRHFNMSPGCSSYCYYGSRFGTCWRSRWSCRSVRSIRVLLLFLHAAFLLFFLLLTCSWLFFCMRLDVYMTF